MELQPSSALFTTIILIILAIFVLRRRSKSNRTAASNLPPGPRKLPIIGNLHNMAGSPPHHALRDLTRKYGPLMYLRLGEVPLVVISSAELAREAMKMHDVTFSDRPPFFAARILFYGATDVIFSPYGEYWRQLRKICTFELLSARRVRSFGWIREEELSNFNRKIASRSGSPVNLSESLFSLAYSITARTAFGKTCRGQEKFISLVTETSKLTSGFDTPDIFPSLTWLHVISGKQARLEKMHHEIDEMLESIIDEHREASRNTTGEGEATMDLIDVLLKFEERDDDGFSLTTSNIKAVIFDMFSAGSETSATIVDWAMAEMVKRPEILEKAQAEVRGVFVKHGKVTEEELRELKFLSAVIKETLRLHPSVPMISRECRESCKIGGFIIPARTKVVVNSWAMGRDPEYWTEPEIFDPERFLDSPVEYKGNDFQYIPFGAGRRICPGITYGMANMEYQLAVLLYHFDWKLPNGMKNEDLDMTELFGLTVRRKDDLFIIPTPYNPKNSSLL